MKPQTPYAIDPDGTLYVMARHACIPPVRLAVDGVTLSRFGDERTTYLAVADAITWHERELSLACDPATVAGHEQCVRLMRNAMDKITWHSTEGRQ